MNNILLTPVLIPSEDAMQPFDLIQRKSDGLLDIYDTELAMEWSKPERTAKNQWRTVRLSLCSKLDIKEGDWYIDRNYGKPIKLKDGKKFEPYLKNQCKKIEFTNDPQLIADGVPAIDGNTKANIYLRDDESASYDLIEVNFLEEFCKRYNQKDNQEVDIKQLASDMASDESEYRGFIEGFKACQALQSSAGGFSLEDMRKCYEGVKQNVGTSIKQSDLPTFDEYIQSLTKESQSKENIIIEYNQETKTLIFK